MLEFFHQLFQTNEFMPHGMCYAWDPTVLWLNVIADSLIAVAYYAIPFLLFYFVWKRRDIAFKGIFVSFGLFILTCGTTHLLDAVTVWTPVYRLDGAVKAVTALASAATFLMLIPMMPTLIRLPSPRQMAAANRALAEEIEVRRSAETEVRRVNEELETRVASRTADYRMATESLKTAIQDLELEMQRRRDLEDQLIQSQKMEAVGRLAGGVAHDFNNLLTVILGYNEMLHEHLKDDPAGLDYALEILRASERASALTNQLLAFSRRQLTAPRIINLNELVQQIEGMLLRIMGEDIELETRLAPDLSAVKADPSNIDQVIMNLVVNSRDAMPKGGKLTIETANVHLTEEYAGSHLGVKPGAYVMLAVSDTGYGMDAATKSRIFEPFYTTKEKGKGTGLGLSIVYGIVKQNSGEILVYSEPGRGTAFKVYLPVVGAEAEALLDGNDGAPAVAATETVLLVEDEEQVRNLTCAILTRQGYRVREAALPMEALAAVRKDPEAIDLLLTDMVMPQMSGMDLAKQVQALLPRIKVLYMSGYTDSGIVNQEVLMADTPFLQKPFTVAALLKKVREVLQS